MNVQYGMEIVSYHEVGSTLCDKGDMSHPISTTLFDSIGADHWVVQIRYLYLLLS